MSNTLNLGTDGNWATKKDSLLAYNSENGNFKPLPFNFTRSTSATRVNKDGLIEVVTNNKPRIDFLNDSNGSLLLEPQRTNLIQYSKDFINSYWTKSGARIDLASATVGAELITVTADRDFSSDTGWWSKSAGVTIAAGECVFTSVTSGAGVYRNNLLSANTLYEVTFDVNSYTTGEFGIYLAGAYYYKNITSTGSFTIYGMSAASGLLDFYIVALGTTTGAIDNVSIKPVSVVTGYSAPSVDFPTSAFKLVESATNAVHTINTTTPAVGSDYSLSIFAKAGERRYISLAFSDLVDWLSQYTFDLTDGVLTDTYNYSGVTSTFKSEALADGWYKLSLSSNYTFDTTVYSRIFIEETATPPTIPANSYLGDGTSGVYLFMAQVEAGSVATSPTFTDTTLASEGSTTTRLADVVNKTGLSSVIGQTEGTIYGEYVFNSVNNSQRIIKVSNGTGASSIDIYPYFDNLRVDINSAAIIVTGGAISVGTRYKFALRYKSGDYALYLNGVLANTSASVSAPTILNQITLATTSGGATNLLNTSSFQVFKEALSNAELATLTTL